MLNLRYCTVLHLIFLHQIGAEPLVGHNVRIADPANIPYIVAIGNKKLRYQGQDENSHVCGGTLITHRHVLTAAHCLEDEDLSNLEVTVGSIDLRSGDRYAVESAVTFKEYAWAECIYFGDYDYDIAILKLSKCVAEEIKVPRITKLKNFHLYGHDAVMAGWGRTDSGSTSRYLQIANTNIISFAECRDKAGAALGRNMDDRFIGSRFLCTRSDPYTLLGCGDSGGPLISNNMELIAIVHGICPNDIFHPDVPSNMRVNLFLGLGYFRSFIKNIIGSREDQSLECTIL